MIKSKAGMIAVSIVMIILGIVIMVYPSQTVDVALRVVGVAFLLAGVSAIVFYFFRKEREKFDIFQCIGGGVFGIVGLFLVSNPGLFAKAVPVAIGLMISVYGILCIVQVMEFQKIEVRGWKIGLGIAVVTLCIGIIIIVNPGKIEDFACRILGVVMAYSGIANIWLAAGIKADGGQPETGSTEIIDPMEKKY